MNKLQKSVGGRRTFERIDFKERVTIENRYCIDKKSIRYIARELGRPPSAVSREIDGRPRIGRGKYTADKGQQEAEDRCKNQGRKTKLAYQLLKDYVIKKLKLGWSPEQIELRLPIDYPKDEKMRISYEAIYQFIYSQIHRGGNGTVKRDGEDLRKYLPRRHTRRQKKGFRKAQKLERSSALPSIEDRPKEVEKRKKVGHWEDDTLVSRQSKVRIKSVNERVSGIVFFGKTKDGTAEECDKVVLEKMKKLPADFRKTLTRDRGTENMGYKKVEKELDISCFFAHPYCSQERGSNENSNGLLRRYFPKKTDFAKVTDEEISRAEHLINSRPRKRYCGLTPYEVFYQETGVALDS
jgi:transposase, IS30 family